MRRLGVFTNATDCLFRGAGKPLVIPLLDDTVQVWDPVAAPLSRKADWERCQMMVQADSRSELQRFLAKWLPMLRARDARGVKWVIDVDPLEV